MDVSLDSADLPGHIAIVPDGNGRWAESRGLPRSDGYRQGIRRVFEIADHCLELGVRYLTFYAFSIENQGRPQVEIDALIAIVREQLAQEGEALIRRGVRIHALGRIGELPRSLQSVLMSLVHRSEKNDRMHLSIAVAYSGRAEIVDAVRRLMAETKAGRLTPSAVDEACFASFLYVPDLPDPDLVIRSGREQRLSNYLLWQSAESELIFSDQLWPDFSLVDLRSAVVEYRRRKRVA